MRGLTVAKKQSDKEPAKGPRFEEALERLEAIVHRLEEGELGLDEALKQYEDGVGLLRRSYELLKQAERRIELLSGVDAEGNPIAEPFDDQATFAGEGGSSGGKRTGRSSGKTRPRENDVDAEGGLF
jgi:exodeoxyribonuclease VII small subunit